MAVDEIQRLVDFAESLTTLNVDVAREAAPGVLKAMQRTAAAGTTPEGVSWPQRAGGGRALPNAAEGLSASVSGPKVTVRLAEPYTYHQGGEGGSSQTKEAKRARAGAQRDRKKREAAGEKVAKSKFHAPARQIIPHPDEPIPAGVGEAIASAAQRVIDRNAKGGS